MPTAHEAELSYLAAEQVSLQAYKQRHINTHLSKADCSAGPSRSAQKSYVHPGRELIVCFQTKKQSMAQCLSKIFITMLRRCISLEVRVVARVATRVANRPSREDITLLCIFL